jgi:hypothetical protein
MRHSLFGLSGFLAVLCAGSASAAEPVCTMARYVTGGVAHVDIAGNDATPLSVSGAVEISTRSFGPPLGLRDGSFVWDTSGLDFAARGAVLGVVFRANLPLSETPQWGTGEGMLVPVGLNFLLPPLRDPTGAVPRIVAVTLISGNGIYMSNNNWNFRSNENAFLVSNTSEPATDIYHRELLQLFADDPSEPITLFLTPGVMGGRVSIVSFHASGLLETPGVVRTLVDEYSATGICPEVLPAAPPP